MNLRGSFYLSACIAAVLTIGSVNSVHAASATWTPTAGGPYNWNLNSTPPWNTAAFPSNAGDIATLTINIGGNNGGAGGNQTISLNQTITLGTLNYGDTGSGTDSAFTFNTGTGGSGFVFDNGASNAVFSKNNSGAIHTFNTDLTIAGNNNLTVAGAAGGTVNISGKLIGGNSANFNFSATSQGWHFFNDLTQFTGTYNITLNGSTITFDGNNNSPTDLLNSQDGSGAKFIVNNGSGSGTLRWGLNNISGNPNTNFKMGELSGNANLRNEGNHPTTLQIGYLNTSTSYTGNLSNGGPAEAVSLEKVGTGVLRIGGTNSYDGTTTVSGGMLVFGKRASLYNEILANWTTANIKIQSGAGAGFGIGGASDFAEADVVNFLNMSTATDFFVNDTTLGLDTSNAVGGNVDFFSPITNTNAGANVLGLMKLGSQRLTLSAANTYTGKTTINDGVLLFSKRVALYNDMPASWTPANIIVNSGGVLALSVGGVDEFTVAEFQTFSNMGTATGGLKDGAAIGIDTTNISGGELVYTNLIADTNGGANKIGLYKLGAGTLTISNATYSGNTGVDGGTLKLAAAGLIPDGAGKGNLSVNGTLDLNGFSEAVNGLSGASSGVIDTLAGGNLTLTVGNNNASTTYAGVIHNTAGSVALVKNGTGTLELTNSSSMYSGGTTLNGGKIRITGSSNPTSPTFGPLASGPIGTGTLTLNGGSFDNVLTSTIGNAIVATASTTTNVTTGGAYDLILTGPLTGAGTIVVSGTGSFTRFQGDISGFTGAFDFQVVNNASSHLFFDGTTPQSQDGSQARFLINGPVGATRTFRFGAFSGSVFKMGELSGSNVTIRNDISGVPTTLQIGNLGTSSEFSGTILNGGQSLANPLGVDPDPIPGAEAISLEKIGNGTLTLSGSNIYQGTTTVSGGRLLVSGNHSYGAAYTVAPGGTLGGIGTINTGIASVGSRANPNVNTGVTVQAGGKLAPGSSAGMLRMDLGTGALDISAAVAASNSQAMLFELGAIAASDQIELLNTTGLNIGSGVLEFNDFAFTNLGGMENGIYTLFNSSTPISGTLGGSLSGMIGSISATLSIGGGGNDIVLTTTGASAPGDYNNDGKVNAADYVVWRKTMPGNVAKYNEWRSNFGNPPGAGAGSSLGDGAVPEPAALVMVGALALCSLALRSQRRRAIG